MNKLRSKPGKYPLIVSVVIVLLFSLGWWLLKDVHIPVLMPSGQVADQQRDLLIFTTLLSLVVVVPVFVMLGWFAWRYREGSNRATYRPEWHKNDLLEALWWGIPIAIIVVLSGVTYVTSHSLDPYRALPSERETVKVQVVALQWKWLFIYPDHGVATVNDLTIPVDTPVHFTLSADAPMSAFWVPDLGSQIYSMNGMSSQLNLIANREGTFTGYNTNINGKGYADMKFAVHSVSESTFADWTKKHSKSGHVLNEHHFHELRQPTTMSAPMYMSLADKDLYQKIIARYTDHGGHGSNEAAKPESDQEHNHEGGHE